MPTKIIMVELEATIALKWTGPVEVPADFDDHKCHTVADEVYGLVDGSDFVEDWHSWERGRCSFREPKAVAGPPLFRVTGHAGGSPVVEAVEPPASDEDPT